MAEHSAPAVFVSFCEKDKEKGQRLAHSLTDLGFPTYHLTFETFGVSRRLLDEYLTKSTFYLLLFSQSYFEEKSEELSMIYTSRMRSSEGKMTLPLLIDLEGDELRSLAPIFASLRSIQLATGEEGIFEVARALYKLTQRKDLPLPISRNWKWEETVCQFVEKRMPDLLQIQTVNESGQFSRQHVLLCEDVPPLGSQVVSVNGKTGSDLQEIRTGQDGTWTLRCRWKTHCPGYLELLALDSLAATAVSTSVEVDSAYGESTTTLLPFPPPSFAPLDPPAVPLDSTGPAPPQMSVPEDQLNGAKPALPSSAGFPQLLFMDSHHVEKDAVRTFDDGEERILQTRVASNQKPVASVFLCYCASDSEFGERLAWDLEDLGFDIHYCDRHSLMTLRKKLSNFLENASYYMIVFSQACYETSSGKEMQTQLDTLFQSYANSRHSAGKEKTILPILLDISPAEFAKMDPVFAHLSCVECANKDSDRKTLAKQFGEKASADEFCGPSSDVWSWRKDNVSTLCLPSLFETRRVQVYSGNGRFKEVNVIHEKFQENVNVPVGSCILQMTNTRIVFNAPIACPKYAKKRAAIWEVPNVSSNPLPKIVSNDGVSERVCEASVVSERQIGASFADSTVYEQQTMEKYAMRTEGSLGFHVKESHDGVIVKKVSDRAKTDLREGDLLLSVDGKDVQGQSYKDVLGQLRSSADHCRFLVQQKSVTSGSSLLREEVNPSLASHHSAVQGSPQKESADTMSLQLTSYSAEPRHEPAATEVVPLSKTQAVGGDTVPDGREKSQSVAFALASDHHTQDDHVVLNEEEGRSSSLHKTAVGEPDVVGMEAAGLSADGAASQKALISEDDSKPVISNFAQSSSFTASHADVVVQGHRGGVVKIVNKHYHYYNGERQRTIKDKEEDDS
eukprot:m.1997 g.1997  ORF g.1997 m.1997 type:complete len:904 (+) comp8158_c0_seq1:89-2800(+)